MVDRTIVSDMQIAAAWNVQGDASRREFGDVTLRMFGIALPATPNTTARLDGAVAFWLGPRSWLLVAESSTPRFGSFVEKRDALNEAGGALFDVSASRVGFRVAGANAAAVLAASCPLDLHPRAFVVGSCAQSVLGHVNALVYKHDAVPTFVVMVARSFGRDVREALVAVAARDQGPA